MAEPKISVVIINRNCARWLPEAMDSALTQSHGNLELVVVDDNSTDHSRDLVRGYAARDPRVVLVCSGETLFTSGARNLGIESATGDYIAFLDADDRMLPDTLERQLAAFAAARARNPAVTLVCFDAYIIGETGERVSRYMPTEYWGTVIDRDAPGYALPSTWFFLRSVRARFLRPWLVAEAGPFLQQMLRDGGGITYVGEPIVEYRMRMVSATHVHARNMLMATEATNRTIARGGDWTRPVTPDDVPEPSWSAVAAWRYGRLAKAAAVNRRPFTALWTLAAASLAQPRVTAGKVMNEVRRRSAVRRPALPDAAKAGGAGQGGA